MSAHITFDLEKGLRDLILMRKPLLEGVLERNEVITLLPASQANDWTYGIGRELLKRWKPNASPESIHVVEFIAAMRDRLANETRGNALAQFSIISDRLDETIHIMTEDRMRNVNEDSRKSKSSKNIWLVLALTVLPTILLMIIGSQL